MPIDYACPGKPEEVSGDSGIPNGAKYRGLPQILDSISLQDCRDWALVVLSLWKSSSLVRLGISSESPRGVNGIRSRVRAQIVLMEMPHPRVFSRIVQEAPTDHFSIYFSKTRFGKFK